MDQEYAYRATRLKETGISLAEFKMNPTGVLNRCGQESAIESITEGHRTLLSAQARAALRIRQEWAGQNRRLAALAGNKMIHLELGLFPPTIASNDPVGRAGELVVIHFAPFGVRECSSN